MLITQQLEKSIDRMAKMLSMNVKNSAEKIDSHPNLNLTGAYEDPVNEGSWWTVGDVQKPNARK